ncbi:putative FG-GAP repeat protein [Tricladium varicosporioides]|nr:putative FG-GAP repeat protein [Hymenoscyphus varicosporioides]
MLSTKFDLPLIGLISIFASSAYSLVLLADPEPDVVGPAAPRATPYQSRILDTATTFAQESNGVWQLIDCTGDGIPDLVYIKTSSVTSVEVHIASQSSTFKDRILEVPTTFAQETSGTWLMVPAKSGTLPDLAYIKTSNTPNGHVEVHIASGASQYKTRTQEVATIFSNENNGSWSLYDYDGDGTLDLVYIKTSSTGSGTVEVHVANGATSYSSWMLQTGTVYKAESNGSWQLAPSSTKNSPNLVYIKSTSASSGMVEVHIASSSGRFQSSSLDVASTFAQEQNGVWSLIDYNKDGALDLTYIKYKNAASGSVEVHVAAG